jgi:hypothetical protein
MPQGCGQPWCQLALLKANPGSEPGVQDVWGLLAD